MQAHQPMMAVLAVLGLALTACAANAVEPSTNAGQTQAVKPGAAAPSAVATAQARTLPSGVVYQSLREGTGASPKASDVVRVHYHGTLADGKVFDSSVQRGQPASFPLNRVIPCWTEGVQNMRVGGKARLTCPPQTAYGARGAGDVIPPNATLTFEVELLAIQ